MAILTAETVEVSTLSIQVKIMTIGKRQVTLAVFRQLPQSNYLQLRDNDYMDDQRMPPYLLQEGHEWGIVNYCPSDCITGEHIHLIWSDSMRLFRDAISKAPPIPSSLNWYLVDEGLGEMQPQSNFRSEFVPEEWATEEQLSEARNRYYRLRDIWDEEYKRIQGLDQLFIAV